MLSLATPIGFGTGLLHGQHTIQSDPQSTHGRAWGRALQLRREPHKDVARTPIPVPSFGLQSASRLIAVHEARCPAHDCTSAKSIIP